MESSRSIIAWNNHVIAGGEITVSTGTSQRPLENLQIPQVPVPYGLILPDSGNIEFTWAPDSPVSVEVLALLSHTLPQSAVVTFSDGTGQVAQQAWNKPDNRDYANNLISVLPDQDTVSEIIVSISGAGSEPVRIGGLWASPALRFLASREAAFGYDSASLAGQVDLTRWTNRRGTGVSIPVTAEPLTNDEAWGKDGGPNFSQVFEQSGTSQPVLLIRRTNDQAWINRTSVYGFLGTDSAVRHLENQMNQATFTVTEMR